MERHFYHFWELLLLNRLKFEQTKFGITSKTIYLNYLVDRVYLKERERKTKNGKIQGENIKYRIQNVIKNIQKKRKEKNIPWDK